VIGVVLASVSHLIWLLVGSLVEDVEIEPGTISPAVTVTDHVTELPDTTSVFEHVMASELRVASVTELLR